MRSAFLKKPKHLSADMRLFTSVPMRDGNLIYFLLLKLRELSFEGRTISMPPQRQAHRSGLAYRNENGRPDVSWRAILSDSSRTIRSHNTG